MKRRSLLAGAGALTLTVAGGACLAKRRFGSMEAYGQAVATMRAIPAASPTLHDLLRYAVLAASGHNAQPWTFRIGEGRIDILPDLSRRTPVVDPDDHHLFVSLGCAAENLALAGAALGHPGEVAFDPAHDGALVFTHARGPARRSALFDAIPARQCTWAAYDGRPVAAADLKTMADAASVPGVDLVLITDRPRMDRIGALVLSGNRSQMADPEFVRELRAWLRFSPAQALQTGDGLFAASSGSPAVPAWLGPTLFDAMVTVASENDRYAAQIASSAGIAVFVAERADHDHWVRVLRACQRFAFQATALGLRHAFLNQPVEVANLRPDLGSTVGMPGRRPDLVMRFGHGSDLPFSARRPPVIVGPNPG